MKREEFASALHRETQGVRVSYRLRSKTLAAAYGKEQRFMKKKIPVVALAMALSVILCATALAVASRAGMLDYQGMFPGVYIPEDAQDSIRTDVLTADTDLIDISVREAYYDGRTARVTVDVRAKDEKVFLAGFDTFSDDSWASLNRLNPDFDESDTRSVADYFTQGGYDASYNISMGLKDPGDEWLSSSGNYSYTEPGVLTFFYQTTFENEAPKREVELSLTVSPFLDRDGEQIERDKDSVVRMKESLPLTSASAREQAYVSCEPVAIADTGVTVDEMQLFVKPQELYVRMYYTVGDSEVGNQPAGGSEAMYGQVKDWFLPELYDPEVVSEDAYDQRLSEGPTGSITNIRLNPDDEEPRRMALEFTLGLNELKDSYHVRIFDYETKTFYGSAEITLREAEEEEIADLPDGE